MDMIKLPNVEAMKAKNDIPGLINALKFQRDQYIRETAVIALHIRMDAAEAFGEIRAIQVVDPLTEASTEYNALVRRKALIALGNIGGHRVVEPLIAALYDQYSENTECAAVLLRNLLNGSLYKDSKKKILKDFTPGKKRRAFRSITKQQRSLLKNRRTREKELAKY